MQVSKTLIAQALLKGYKQADIARELGVDRAFVSMVKAGKRRFSPQQAVLVAGLGGQDAILAMELATIEGEENPTRRAKLMEILGKVLAVGEAVMSPISYNGPVKSDMALTVKSELPVNSLYIVSKSLRLVHNLERWAGNRLRSKAVHPASGSPKTVQQGRARASGVLLNQRFA